MLFTSLLSASLLSASALGAAILAERENSNVAITMYTDQNCRGTAARISNVQYDHQNVAPQNFLYFSFRVEGRALRSDEQLDFSRAAGSDLCALFKNSFGPLAVGCYNNEAVTCFRLTKH